MIANRTTGIDMRGHNHPGEIDGSFNDSRAQATRQQIASTNRRRLALLEETLPTPPVAGKFPANRIKQK